VESSLKVAIRSTTLSIVCLLGATIESIIVGVAESSTKSPLAHYCHTWDPFHPDLLLSLLPLLGTSVIFWFTWQHYQRGGGGSHSSSGGNHGGNNGSSGGSGKSQSRSLGSGKSHNRQRQKGG